MQNVQIIQNMQNMQNICKIYALYARYMQAQENARGAVRSSLQLLQCGAYVALWN